MNKTNFYVFCISVLLFFIALIMIVFNDFGNNYYFNLFLYTFANLIIFSNIANFLLNKKQKAILC